MIGLPYPGRAPDEVALAGAVDAVLALRPPWGAFAGLPWPMPERSIRSTDQRSAAMPGPDPRVTLGIATYNRDTYLAEAIRSGLRSGHRRFEVLVVVDGSGNPAIEEPCCRASRRAAPARRPPRAEPRDRSRVQHIRLRGSRRADRDVGDDDLCLPGRLRRQVEVFDDTRRPGCPRRCDRDRRRRTADRCLEQPRVHDRRRWSTRSTSVTTISSIRAE